jgi:ADP-ribose pyrophosphatase
MTPPPEQHVLGQGRFLRLVRRNGWEFVERTVRVRSAFIGAVTDAGCLLTTEEYREPVARPVIGCPAGLIGDGDAAGESLEAGVVRELEEETGYRAGRVTVLCEGPTSPGQTDEVISVVLAEGLTRVGPGGGVGGERIAIQEVPLAAIDAWLRAKVRGGVLVDPKVYTVLYFLRQRIPPAAAQEQTPR